MMRRSVRWSALLLLVVVAGIVGCTEDSETGSTCPMLCPGQSLPLYDTIIQPAYVFDTTLVGWPQLGLDNQLLLTKVGDSLDVRTVIRFDSLVYRYVPPDSTAYVRPTALDSVFLTLRMWPGDFPIYSDQVVVLSLYDVTDTLLADSATAALLPMFTPERLIGKISLDSAALVDTLRKRIPLTSGHLLDILQDSAPKLRIGIAITSAAYPADLLIRPENSGADGPALDYRLTPDTLVPAIVGLQPSSVTPRGNPFFAGDLTDYIVIAQAPPAWVPNRIVVGGLPSARAYLRFNLPLWLRDSVGVVRIRLEMTQEPVHGVSETDSVLLRTHLVGATTNVTDIWRAATVLSSSDVFVPSVTRLPNDSGPVFLNLAGLLAQWRGTSSTLLPPAVVLRAASEGLSARALRFYSATHPDTALRPRLRVTYTPPLAFGRP